MTDTHDWLTPLVNAVVDHALRTGRFETVNRQESVSPPGHGITVEVWPGPGRTVPRASGLAATTIVQVIMIRLRCPALGEARAEVDPAMVAALSQLLSAYHADLTLGGTCQQIDLMGAFWPQGLRWEAGWMSQTVRAYDVWLPLVIGDLWPQEIQGE